MDLTLFADRTTSPPGGRARLRPGGGWTLRAAALALALPAFAQPAADAPWTVAGQQGVVRFVIVPADAAKDRSAYERQIAQLCQPGRTCFLNFYTNSTGATLAVPLPDVISHEATAVFRRSEKQQAERFQWSCRLSISNEPCF